MRVPLAYRILLVLPTVYRKWASARLAAMEDWIGTWATPEMFAGIKGKGAQDGWYDTAIAFELANAHGLPVTGAAADIHKCFDQIQRQVVYKTAEMAGMPKGILHAYKAFHAMQCYGMPWHEMA